jgi:hypothetical protein
LFLISFTERDLCINEEIDKGEFETHNADNFQQISTCIDEVVTRSPIKRLLSTAQTFPMQEKGFKLCFSSHRHCYLYRYFFIFRCQPLLHQSPIRIKAC